MKIPSTVLTRGSSGLKGADAALLEPVKRIEITVHVLH